MQTSVAQPFSQIDLSLSFRFFVFFLLLCPIVGSSQIAIDMKPLDCFEGGAGFSTAYDTVFANTMSGVHKLFRRDGIGKVECEPISAPGFVVVGNGVLFSVGDDYIYLRNQKGLWVPFCPRPNLPDGKGFYGIRVRGDSWVAVSSEPAVYTTVDNGRTWWKIDGLGTFTFDTDGIRAYVAEDWGIAVIDMSEGLIVDTIPVTFTTSILATSTHLLVAETKVMVYSTVNVDLPPTMINTPGVPRTLYEADERVFSIQPGRIDEIDVLQHNVIQTWTYETDPEIMNANSLGIGSGFFAIGESSRAWVSLHDISGVNDEENGSRECILW